MKQKFIYCKDKELAEKLKQSYKLLCIQNDIYVFENELTGINFDFAEIDKSNYTYSNKLLF